jgi:hypothetical protein
VAPSYPRSASADGVGRQRADAAEVDERAGPLGVAGLGDLGRLAAARDDVVAAGTVASGTLHAGHDSTRSASRAQPGVDATDPDRGSLNESHVAHPTASNGRNESHGPVFDAVTA